MANKKKEAPSPYAPALEAIDIHIRRHESDIKRLRDRMLEWTRYIEDAEKALLDDELALVQLKEAMSVLLAAEKEQDRGSDS